MNLNRLLCVLSSGSCIVGAARKRNVDALFADSHSQCPCGDGDYCSKNRNEQCDEGANNGKPGETMSARGCNGALFSSKANIRILLHKRVQTSSERHRVSCERRHLRSRRDVRRPKRHLVLILITPSSRSFFQLLSTPCSPTDRFVSSTTVCRASTKPCDKPENCSGRSKTCPADAAWEKGRVCRSARSGEACDAAERCDGTSKDWSVCAHRTTCCFALQTNQL